MAVALAAALTSVRRGPADQSRWVDQTQVRDTDAHSAERDRAWRRANHARGLAAKEYLDHRATPADHPAAAMESHERTWTAADHSRWRRLALTAQDGSRFATAARLSSVRSVGARSQPAPLPSLGGPRRRQPARSR
ncbi:hypothetical protein [Micromonospora sp. NPDC051296]|uniref:hypothetical protein n=1 Tax=Micromonospora sp. NPDC051296 TaxID=3155046 RepID=UPI0034410B3D